MSKKVVVLIGDVGPSGERFTANMAKYSKDNYVLKRYTDICITIKHGKVDISFFDDGTHIDDSDLVYLRGITDIPVRHAIGAYLHVKGIPVVNTESSHFQTMTKLEQYVVLALKGIPVPDSVFVSKVKYYRRALEAFTMTFPVVAKSITGRNGKDNMLVNSWDELEQLDIPGPIFQPFIPNEFDYRVILAGDRVALAYKRIRADESKGHKNNISQGGKREMIELPKDLRDLALQAGRAVQREFSGVDILTNSTTGKSVVLEVNFNFGTPMFDDINVERRYYENLTAYFDSLAKQ